MIEDLIQSAVKSVTRLRGGSSGILTPATPSLARGVPTLEPGFYRPLSPMLVERFTTFGRWEMATHGVWLSLLDMEQIWTGQTSDDVMRDVLTHRHAGEEDWPNDASSLFKPKRLSMFAGSDIDYEKIYLLWLDDLDEPELWVYDANGESRYANLETYLRAFLASDVSASKKSWRASDMQER